MSYVLKPVGARRIVRTSIYEKVLDTIDFTLKVKGTSLLVGKPGIGKTTALLDAAETDSKAVYVMIGNGQRTLRALYRAVMAAFQIPNYSRNTQDLCEAIYTHLPGHVEAGRYLLLDEVQTLDLSAFRELLNFNEVCGLPLILSGNPSVLKRTKITVAGYDQIRDRIWKKVQLNSPVRDDFVSLGVDYDLQGQDAYEALVILGLQTSIRQVVQVLEIARQFRGESGPIKLGHLQDAVEFLTEGGSKNIALASPGLRESFAG